MAETITNFDRGYVRNLKDSRNHLHDLSWTTTRLPIEPSTSQGRQLLLLLSLLLPIFYSSLIDSYLHLSNHKLSGPHILGYTLIHHLQLVYPLFEHGRPHTDDSPFWYSNLTGRYADCPQYFLTYYLTWTTSSSMSCNALLHHALPSYIQLSMYSP